MPAPTRPLSPELLHQGIRLVKAPTWILAVVLLGAVIVVLLWGIFGTVLVQVSGRGLLIHADNQQVPMFSAEQARLRKTRVSIGDPVVAGQVLFDLDASTIDIELELARQRLRELGGVLSVVSANGDKAVGEQERVSTGQLAALQRQHQQLQGQVDYYAIELPKLEGLLSRGLATAGNVETMREHRDSAVLEQVQSDGKRVQVESELLVARMSWQRRQLDAQLAADQQQAQVSEIEHRRERASQIVAQRDGFVTEILVNDGQIVGAGSKVAIVSTQAPGYQVLAFFKPLNGKRLVAGMETDIVPSTVKREEYGTMKGVVGDTSIRPISLEQTTELLGNATLAHYLTGDAPPIVGRINVAMSHGAAPSVGARDAFVWRNGGGPPFSVTAGTVADVKVTVQRQAPITLALPYLKTLVGW